MSSPVRSVVEAALADPWTTLDRVVDGPLHPGGADATEALLDRAGVDGDARLLDLGCGAGATVDRARGRGARAVGIDRSPTGPGTVRGDLRALPVADGAVDAVVAECALCLSPDLDRSLAEVRRVLVDGGRLALSDVVVEGPLPDLPEPIARLCCLSSARERAELVARVEDAGFVVEDRRDHRAELIEMRDRIAESVNYEQLLGALGDRGAELLDGVKRLESAVEDGRVGYVSMVARAE